jgi:hypothetical protein
MPSHTAGNRRPLRIGQAFESSRLEPDLVAAAYEVLLPCIRRPRCHSPAPKSSRGQLSIAEISTTRRATGA